MAIFLFADNARTILGAPVLASATSITLASGAGAKFPSPGAGQQFALTLNDQATGNIFEVCYCTARSGDVLTVVRGQEGTAAVAWSLGDFAWNGPTSGQQNAFVQYPHMTDASIAPVFAATTVDGPATVNGTASISGTGYVGGGVVATGQDPGAAQWRAVAGSYGVILYNDGGTNAYLMSTNAGNPYGIWSGYRPFIWNMGNGTVTIDATGSGAYFGGSIVTGSTVQGGFIYSPGGTVQGGYLHSTGNVQADGSLTTSFDVDANRNANISGTVTGGHFHCTGNSQVDNNLTANNSVTSNLITSNGAVNCGSISIAGGALTAGFAGNHSFLNMYFNNGWLFDPNTGALDFFRSDGLLLLQLDQTGDLLVLGNVQWPNYSDVRLKRNIEPYTRGLDHIVSLKPIAFEWNGKGGTTDDGRRHFGIAAQEAQPYFPEAVSVTPELKHRDEDTPDIRLPEQLEFDDKAVLWALVNATKELHEMLGEQAREIAVLRQRLGI